MKHFYKYLLVAILGIATTSLVSCNDKDDTSPDTPEQPEVPTPDIEKPQNYIEYNGSITELKSLYYVINDVDDLGYQYAMAMSANEGVESFDDIINSEEYIFVSLEESTIFDAIDNNNGRINVLDISEEDVVYMFVAKHAGLDIQDNANNHLNIISGEIIVSIDEQSYAITIEANYKTVVGDVVVVATLQFEESKEQETTDSYFNYTWGDISINSAIGSAYAEQRANGVTYTVCKDSIKTYAYYEDTPFLKLDVADKSIDDNFTIDINTYDGEFSIWACDPIKGMDLKVSNTNRENCSGTISVKSGVLTCKNLYFDSPSGEQDDVLIDIYFADSYRTVNECVKISYDERTELFTPRSVLLDNSGEEEYMIYVSSHANITSIEQMTNPDIVITYPKEGWEKWLMKRNFISGSSYPDMTFKYKKTTYYKGKNDCYGMNAQIPEYDIESGRLRLNLNLYTEEGGIALYYSGEFTIIE